MNFLRQISNANICPKPCLAICAHGLTFVLVPLGFNFTAPWKPNKKLAIFARYDELDLTKHLLQLWLVASYMLWI